MGDAATDMLRRLAGAGAAGVRGAGATAPMPAPPGPRSLGALDFAALLSKARSGELASERAVTLDPGVGVELTGEQVARLAAAADRAEAEGFATAVVLIDGMSLVLDVAARRIVRRVDAGAPVASGIDGVVAAARSSDELDSTGAPVTVGAAASGRALLAALRTTPPLALSRRGGADGSE